MILLSRHFLFPPLPPLSAPGFGILPPANSAPSPGGALRPPLPLQPPPFFSAMLSDCCCSTSFQPARVERFPGEREEGSILGAARQAVGSREKLSVLSSSFPQWDPNPLRTDKSSAFSAGERKRLADKCRVDR
jgi:hypothetical protein